MNNLKRKNLVALFIFMVSQVCFAMDKVPMEGSFFPTHDSIKSFVKDSIKEELNKGKSFNPLDLVFNKEVLFGAALAAGTFGAVILGLKYLGWTTKHNLKKDLNSLKAESKRQEDIREKQLKNFSDLEEQNTIIEEDVDRASYLTQEIQTEGIKNCENNQLQIKTFKQQHSFAQKRVQRLMNYQTKQFMNFLSSSERLNSFTFCGIKATLKNQGNKVLNQLNKQNVEVSGKIQSLSEDTTKRLGLNNSALNESEQQVSNASEILNKDFAALETLNQELLSQENQQNVLSNELSQQMEVVEKTAQQLARGVENDREKFGQLEQDSQVLLKNQQEGLNILSQLSGEQFFDQPQKNEAPVQGFNAKILNIVLGY